MWRSAEEEMGVGTAKQSGVKNKEESFATEEKPMAYGTRERNEEKTRRKADSLGGELRKRECKSD